MSIRKNARHVVPRALMFDPQAEARLHSIESEHAVERDVHTNRNNTDQVDSRTVIYLRLKLVVILFEFLAGRLERAAARRILMAEAASFAGLLSICWRGADWPRNSHGHRARDQYCGRRAANKDDGFFCMHLHIRFLHC